MKKTAKPKKSTRAKKSAAPKSSAFYGQSKRLGFRLITPADEALFIELYTDAKTLEYVHPPLSPEQAAKSFAKALEYTATKPLKQHISVVVERGSKRQIGISSIKLIDADKRIAEGGILLKPSAHAQRFAIESSLALISCAFRYHSIDELTAQIAVGHKAGEKLVKSSGYMLIGQIPPQNNQGPRTRWGMTREYWAEHFK